MYRRRYSSVYDTLGQVSWANKSLFKAKLALFADSCEELAGYEVYSGSFIKRK